MMRSFIFLSLVSLLSHDLNAGFNGPADPVTYKDSLSSVSWGASNPQSSGHVSAQDWEALFAATIGRTQRGSHDMEIEPAPASESQVAPLPDKTFQHEAEFYNEDARRAGEPLKDYSYASSSTDQFAGLEFDGILGCPVPLPNLAKMSEKDMKKYRREFLMPVGNIGRKLMLIGRVNPEQTNSLLSDLHAFYGERVHSILDKPQEIHAFVLSLEKWELYLSQFQVADSQGIEPVISPLWRLPQYKSLFTSPNLSFLTQVKLMNISTPAVLDEALRGVALREDRELKVMTGDLQKLDLQGGKRPAEVEVPGSADTKGRRKKKKPYR